ncbi:Afadin- and alpha-actinin-binding protein isoform 3 [Hibiscus syriacus]|uniref:Afadin-and alpha-actinin-binding protein isoform 3 n=1 Tax=Hibiscus syriacus TaxID=106335 RepID=A0A6A2Y0K0_HIBSY|nr:Afadin- and alpha-actinin-binding protein isoform 3 [Hibiscus syriacus]
MPSTDADFGGAPPSQSAFSIGEYTFADAGNLDHCTKYLNQTLVTFGFPASLDLFADDPVSVARTCNGIYSLLQQRQRDIDFRESANEQRQRCLPFIHDTSLQLYISLLQQRQRDIDFRESANEQRQRCLPFIHDTSLLFMN